ncbi:MAG TPA: neutral zinc metallopeptidase [Actinomycetota bacterium]|nr:neutral zinc metallopeptidase [Actinomycetota bacterium]
MRLKKLRRRSGGVIDRRGQAGPSLGGIGFPRSSGGGFPMGAGGLSIGTIVLLVVVVGAFMLCGGGGSMFGDALAPFGDAGTVQPNPNEAQVDPQDPTGEFVDGVMDDVQTTWIDLFERAGQRYEPTAVVLFQGSTESACGVASQRTGPFYCPADKRVYLDTSFFQELERQFGASGDFAEAYVIAHEVAHHVQTLLGINAEVQGQSREDPSIANELSVRLELQADCFAGVWGRAAQAEGILQPGDVEEGLNAASAIGDDRIQEATTGRVNPESFTHGTAEQRAAWLRTGIQVGNPDACDTFDVPYDEL